jgi:hypothetical protein
MPTTGLWAASAFASCDGVLARLQGASSMPRRGSCRVGKLTKCGGLISDCVRATAHHHPAERERQGDSTGRRRFHPTSAQQGVAKRLLVWTRLRPEADVDDRLFSGIRLQGCLRLPCCHLRQRGNRQQRQRLQPRDAHFSIIVAVEQASIALAAMRVRPDSASRCHGRSSRGGRALLRAAERLPCAPMKSDGLRCWGRRRGTLRRQRAAG